VTADPRLLARLDEGISRWRITEGIYRVAFGKSVTDYVSTAATRLTSRLLETDVLV
jgi:hypothetical protein